MADTSDNSINRSVWMKMYRSPSVLLFVVVLTGFLTNCDLIASPEGEERVNVSGVVRDAAGRPLPNATVSLEIFTKTTFVEVRTDTAGFYRIVYDMKHIVTDEGFRDRCYVWYRDGTNGVSLAVRLSGYRLDSVDGDFRCDGVPQTINATLHPL